MLEIVVTIFGLIQGGLIMFKKKENWYFLFLQSVCYVIFAFQNNLYADVIEQSIYIILSLLGFTIWYQKLKFKIFNKRITFLSGQKQIIAIISLCCLSYVFYTPLKNSNDPFPLLDAITTAIGFIATYLMANKNIECWILWFISDVLGIYIYFNLPDKAIWLGILNFIWTFMAIGSFNEWYKEISDEESLYCREIC